MCISILCSLRISLFSHSSPLFSSSLLLCVAVIQCNETADCILYSSVALLWLPNGSTRAHRIGWIEWKKAAIAAKAAITAAHTKWFVCKSFIYTNNFSMFILNFKFHLDETKKVKNEYFFLSLCYRMRIKNICLLNINYCCWILWFTFMNFSLCLKN